MHKIIEGKEIKGKSRAHTHIYMHRTPIHIDLGKKASENHSSLPLEMKQKEKESKESRIVDACSQCHSDKYNRKWLLFDELMFLLEVPCFRVSVCGNVDSNA